jgi:hypothetical protein
MIYFVTKSGNKMSKERGLFYEKDQTICSELQRL